MNYQYFNRDISWLSFNYRVFEQAKDKNLPLYERIKFLAIYSSNLDEFYKVRVASYRSLLEVYDEKKFKLSFDPEEILIEINTIVSQQLREYYNLFEKEIRPELVKHNIIINTSDKLCEEHEKFIDEYFFTELLPYLQPIILEKGDVRTFLQDNKIYFAVKLLKKKKRKNQKEGKSIFKKKKKFAILKIPTHRRPRFIQLPKTGDRKHHIIFQDEIIRKNLSSLFPGYEIDSAYSIQLLRNADLGIEDEFDGNITNIIQKSLSQRKIGTPARFLYDSTMPDKFLNFLRQAFGLPHEDLVAGGRYHNLSDFWGFPNPGSPKLEVHHHPPLHINDLDNYETIFKAIRQKDWVFHYPYQTYDYVVKFLNEAAMDDKVIEIKTTQYRVASNSAIVAALIRAARNGKKVTVFVEMKARFDEEHNLETAKQMEEAGVKIIPSLPGLKVHAKVALVLRKPKEGTRKGYAYLSTGNFNEKTAKIYADHGLFTSDQPIITDLMNLFEYLENQRLKLKFNNILVAQINMLDTFLRYIKRETENAKQGKKAYMLLKMNGLEDKEVINHLYEASQAGVKIDLLLRGVCCLVPNKPYSQNIRVIRIVDGFLEHARIYYFYNDNNDEMFISSADFMERNLRRRIETGIPIKDRNIKKELLDLLKIQLADNVSARYINENLQNIEIAQNDRPVRAQEAMYQYLKNKANSSYKPLSR